VEVGVDWRVDDTPRFEDRRQAGRELAALLSDYAGRNDVVVLGLPRGGVPVAFEVARALRAPLDVFIVRKLGAPGQHELAIGAIASGGVRVMNDDIVRWYGLTEAAIDEMAAQESIELDRRERLYRGDRPLIDVAGRTVVLVDDGLATGSTMKAAVRAIRMRGPARVIVAVPVGAPESCKEFERIADAVVCARAPQPFSAVGLWYRDFSQTTDEEVRELLQVPADK
jgi:putative phosphoribosyl transferase